MIREKYVLFTRIPLLRNSSGRLFTDSLWAKDLKLHLAYIEDFSLCCPVTQADDTTGFTDITDYKLRGVFPLRQDRGLASVLANFIPNFWGVTKACRSARIVHSGGAGWAFPLSFYLLLLRPFLPFKWVIVIESSFWMLGAGDKVTPRKFIDHHIHKLLLTQCVRKADARIFTQSFYRQYFLGSDTERTLIWPATWIDEDVVQQPGAVESRHRSRIAGPLKIIFPARLVADKGVYVVLAAIRELDARGIPLHLTIMGAGELQRECEAFASERFGHVSVRFSLPVEYGEPFFLALREYDFVLVPNLKEEQPRIVFDAFSQGVGVVASRTTGILDITNADNAVTFTTGSASDLADAVAHLAQNRQRASEMGLAGLRSVAGRTHWQMHIDREAFLKQVL